MDDDIVAGFDRPASGVEAVIHIQTLAERVLDGDRLEDGRLDVEGLHTALRRVWELAEAGLRAEALGPTEEQEGEE